MVRVPLIAGNDLHSGLIHGFIFFLFGGNRREGHSTSFLDGFCRFKKYVLRKLVALVRYERRIRVAIDFLGLLKGHDIEPYRTNFVVILRPVESVGKTRLLKYAIKVGTYSILEKRDISRPYTNSNPVAVVVLCQFQD